MHFQIHILRVDVRRGISRKSGNAYVLAEAQCVYHVPNPETGELQPSVGQMFLPRGQEETKPGHYDAEFTLRTNREGKVEASIARLVPRVESLKAQPKVA